MRKQEDCAVTARGARGYLEWVSNLTRFTHIMQALTVKYFHLDLQTTQKKSNRAWILNILLYTLIYFQVQEFFL